MPETNSLILWDIDGTLLRSKGARVTGKAFLRALKLASNAADDLVYPKDAHGNTDTQIALDILTASLRLDGDATAVLKVFGQAYVADLEGQRQSLLDDIEVLPGAPEILRALKRRGVTQSLLTGNLEPVARLKLALAQLDQFLSIDIGAFGSDHADRTCLVPIAQARVLSKLGYAVRPETIVIVGDTPRDVACARAGGAHVVCVATGNFTREQLEAHAPDAVLDDLRDTDAVIETLLRYSTYSDQSQALIV